MKIGLLLLMLMGALLFSFAAWRLFARRRQVRPAVARPARFAAVKIEADINCCLAAQKLVDKAFLLRQAPHLPLEHCDAARCNCRFLRQTDRREEERRGPQFALQERFTLPQHWVERCTRGRRKNDMEESKRARQSLQRALRQSDVPRDPGCVLPD